MLWNVAQEYPPVLTIPWKLVDGSPWAPWLVAGVLKQQILFVRHIQEEILNYNAVTWDYEFDNYSCEFTFFLQ